MKSPPMIVRFANVAANIFHGNLVTTVGQVLIPSAQTVSTTANVFLRESSLGDGHGLSQTEVFLCEGTKIRILSNGHCSIQCIH